MYSQKLEKRCTYSRFRSEKGNDEFFIVINSAPSHDFKTSIKDIERSLANAMKKLKLPTKSLVFTRFYLSDIANERNILLKSSLYTKCRAGTVSVIQQAPLDTSHLKLFCYFILNGTRPLSKKNYSYSDDGWQNGVTVKGSNYEMLYTGNFIGRDEFNSYKQTQDIFKNYIRLLKEHKLNLLNNTVRTWIYCRDIDNHYMGMVNARREIFDKQGLTKDTHYPASTGIEGKAKEVNTLVTMDALSYKNIKPEQIIKMEALKNLCPTHDYNVTFERGIRLMFGDRSHMYISGTASIDTQGDVMYLSDTIKQTKRTLTNIKALLKEQGADMSQLAYLIVYLRDPSFHDAVLDIVWEEVSGTIPVIAVEGSVCRPTWLVEMEGIAIKKEQKDYPPFL